MLALREGLLTRRSRTERRKSLEAEWAGGETTSCRHRGRMSLCVWSVWRAIQKLERHITNELAGACASGTRSRTIVRHEHHSPVLSKFRIGSQVPRTDRFVVVNIPPVERFGATFWTSARRVATTTVRHEHSSTLTAFRRHRRRLDQPASKAQTEASRAAGKRPNHSRSPG